MYSKENTVCFTGHRKIRKSDKDLYTKVYNVVESLILQGFLCFCAGGARGFDTLAAEAVLSLREKYDDVKLVLVLPFLEQYKKEESWTDEEIDRFISLTKKADSVVYLQRDYSKSCYYKRNQLLVEYSSVCVCYKSRKTGGTAYTVELAQNEGLKIINLIEK